MRRIVPWQPFWNFRKSKNSDVTLQINQADFRPARFIDYREAIGKIRKTATKLKKELSKQEASKVLPSFAFYILLRAEMEVLLYLNDENLNCQVPWNDWDMKVGLPSIPSMIADARKHRTAEESFLYALLHSFFSWTVFARETLDCSHGSGPKREVKDDIMMNYVLSSEDNALVIKQLVGVKSDDLSHLEHHYDL